MAWISNYIHHRMWDEIIFPFPNFNGCTVEVWEWISNFISYFTGHVIIYPCKKGPWGHNTEQAGKERWRCLFKQDSFEWGHPQRAQGLVKVRPIYLEPWVDSNPTLKAAALKVIQSGNPFLKLCFQASVIPVWTMACCPLCTRPFGTNTGWFIIR